MAMAALQTIKSFVGTRTGRVHLGKDEDKLRAPAWQPSRRPAGS